MIRGILIMLVAPTAFADTHAINHATERAVPFKDTPSCDEHARALLAQNIQPIEAVTQHNGEIWLRLRGVTEPTVIKRVAGHVGFVDFDAQRSKTFYVAIGDDSVTFGLIVRDPSAPTCAERSRFAVIRIQP